MCRREVKKISRMFTLVAVTVLTKKKRSYGEVHKWQISNIRCSNKSSCYQSAVFPLSFTDNLIFQEHYYMISFSTQTNPVCAKNSFSVSQGCRSRCEIFRKLLTVWLRIQVGCSRTLIMVIGAAIHYLPANRCCVSFVQCYFHYYSLLIVTIALLFLLKSVIIILKLF